MCGACEDIMSDFCPCCNESSEVEEEECQICHGTGFWYFDENGTILTRAEYDALPEDQRLKENCNICNPARLVNGKWEVNDIEAKLKLAQKSWL